MRTGELRAQDSITLRQVGQIALCTTIAAAVLFGALAWEMGAFDRTPMTEVTCEYCFAIGQVEEGWLEKSRWKRSHEMTCEAYQEYLRRQAIERERRAKLADSPEELARRLHNRNAQTMRTLLRQAAYDVPADLFHQKRVKER